ncbi:MAG TPA: hypothetical protein VNN22_01855 [Verrucomicrobiae bacterium]|nr:hypothetical protein [Verrucomicrobiae bacterium]
MNQTIFFRIPTFVAALFLALGLVTNARCASVKGIIPEISVGVAVHTSKAKT